MKISRLAKDILVIYATWIYKCVYVIFSQNFIIIILIIVYLLNFAV